MNRWFVTILQEFTTDPTNTATASNLSTTTALTIENMTPSGDAAEVSRTNLPEVDL
jgi:hypothetical protein